MPGPASANEAATQDDCALRSEETAAIGEGAGFATAEEVYADEISQLIGIDGEFVASIRTENLAAWELIRDGQVRGEIRILRTDGLWNFERSWFCFPE